MSQCSDTLHFNGVHLVERVVQDTGGIDDLPSEVLVVEMAHEEGFGGEGVRLNIHICSSDLVHKARLADIGVTTAQQCSGGRVNGGETAHVLPDLFQIGQWVFLSFNDGGHTTESGFLELLASIERVTKLEQSGIIFADGVDQVSSSVDLTQSQLVMVLVVQDVEQR